MDVIPSVVFRYIMSASFVEFLDVVYFVVLSVFFVDILAIAVFVLHFLSSSSISLRFLSSLASSLEFRMLPSKNLVRVFSAHLLTAVFLFSFPRSNRSWAYLLLYFSLPISLPVLPFRLLLSDLWGRLRSTNSVLFLCLLNKAGTFLGCFLFRLLAFFASIVHFEFSISLAVSFFGLSSGFPLFSLLSVGVLDPLGLRFL